MYIKSQYQFIFLIVFSLSKNRAIHPLYKKNNNYKIYYFTFSGSGIISLMSNRYLLFMTITAKLEVLIITAKLESINFLVI